MPKTKTRKESVKRLIDASGNVQAMIYIEFTEGKDSLFVGYRLRASYDAAMSDSALNGIDLYHHCDAVPSSESCDMGYHSTFNEYATRIERELVKTSAKFPFSFYIGSGVSSLCKFSEALDDVKSPYLYDLEALYKIAKEKGWSVV